MTKITWKIRYKLVRFLATINRTLSDKFEAFEGSYTSFVSPRYAFLLKQVKLIHPIFGAEEKGVAFES